MAWPFPMFLRPIVRYVFSMIGLDYPEPEIIERAQLHPHYWAQADVEAAAQEAGRATYFLDFLRARPGAASFGSVWFAAARGAWYAGYGRAPSASEREWAYTRPQGQLGLYVRAHGETMYSHRAVDRDIKVNANWNSSWSDVEAEVRALVTSNRISFLIAESEPIDPDSLTLTLERGALLAFVDPLISV